MALAVNQKLADPVRIFVLHHRSNWVFASDTVEILPASVPIVPHADTLLDAAPKVTLPESPWRSDVTFGLPIAVRLQRESVGKSVAHMIARSQ